MAARASVRVESIAGSVVPPIRLDMRHVLGQGVRVHRDLRMVVRAEDRRTLGTDSAIAERGALRADRDDSHVSATVHPPGLHLASDPWILATLT
jgi:hypothetical protein